MRFDQDLAAAILRALEDNDEADGSHLVPVRIEGRSAREISYHVCLLAEVGLLIAHQAADIWTPRRLTWTGHEALLAERERATEEDEAIERDRATLAQHRSPMHLPGKGA